MVEGLVEGPRDWFPRSTASTMAAKSESSPNSSSMVGVNLEEERRVDSFMGKSQAPGDGSELSRSFLPRLRPSSAVLLYSDTAIYPENTLTILQTIAVPPFPSVLDVLLILCSPCPPFLPSPAQISPPTATLPSTKSL